MFISSITLGLTTAVFAQTAFSIITSYNSSLFLAESFFESLMYNMSQSFGNITAPATTGPANGPRPTSSIPHINS